MISKDKPTAHLFFANRAAIADATAAAAADAVVFYFFFASLFYHYFDLWKLRAPWLRRVFVSRLLPSPARCRHHWNDRFNFYFFSICSMRFSCLFSMIRSFRYKSHTDTCAMRLHGHAATMASTNKQQHSTRESVGETTDNTCKWRYVLHRIKKKMKITIRIWRSSHLISIGKRCIL